MFHSYNLRVCETQFWEKCNSENSTEKPKEKEKKSKNEIYQNFLLNLKKGNTKSKIKKVHKIWRKNQNKHKQYFYEKMTLKNLIK